MCLCENLPHRNNQFCHGCGSLTQCFLFWTYESCVFYCLILNSGLCFSLVFSCLCVSDYVVYLCWFRLILGSLSVWSSVSCLHAYVPPCVCISLPLSLSLSLCLSITLPHPSHVSLFCLLYLFPCSFLCVSSLSPPICRGFTCLFHYVLLSSSRVGVCVLVFVLLPVLFW